MPFMIIAFLVAVFIVVLAVNVAKRGSAHWATGKLVDWVLFLTTLASFIFTLMFTAQIGIFVSDTNIPVVEVLGGQLLNIASLFVPVLLFIATILSLIRLIQNMRNPVRASNLTDKENYGQGSRTRR